MRHMLNTVWGQIVLFTVACMAASVAITAMATYPATGTLQLGIGPTMPLLILALVVPAGSYWHISMTHRLRRVNAELTRLSETDPLTDTFNRRRFIELAERQLVLAHRHAYPTSVLLPHTAREGAGLVADRLMGAVRGHTFVHDGQPIQATVSIGGVSCGTSRTPLDHMTSRADTLLYDAKHAGRDCCRVEDVESD
jgi:GGDEF domain-containing protein